MDSFESAAEPVSVQGQQTHYAKSNLVKGMVGPVPVHRNFNKWSDIEVYEMPLHIL